MEATEKWEKCLLSPTPSTKRQDSREAGSCWALLESQHSVDLYQFKAGSTESSRTTSTKGTLAY